ncbi:MAG TPA: DUF3592 domain-containing protein [Candidatus Acidoferrales bacterium]|jgi:hypothetical protein|nr:DUF3592 domain-containing protein [Candidatus Acidoferrales bacterium]
MATIIPIVIVLVIGIGIGFMLGFSRAMREAANRLQQRNDAKHTAFVGRLVLVLGLACLIVDLGVSVHTWHFKQVAQHASGTIIEMLQDKGKDSGGTSYAPTFRFQDANGMTHTVSSSMYTSPPEFHVGDIVPVLYQGDRPQAARIDSYWQVWGQATLLGIIGGLTAIFGSVTLFWPKLKARSGGQTSS